MLPVDRRGPEDEVEEGTVEDFFNLAPLPPLENEGGFLWLGPHRRRGVGCKCPRWVGEAHQGLSEHGKQRGQSQRLGPGKILISVKVQSKPKLGYECLTENYVSTQKPKPVA